MAASPASRSLTTAGVYGRRGGPAYVQMRTPAAQRRGRRPLPRRLAFTGVDRRTFLRYGTAGVLLPGAVAGALAGRSLALIRHRSPAVRRFAVPLPVPPVLRPTSTAGGVDEYDVTQRAADASILPGRPTRIWGYDGIFPGPTIEARRGRPVVVRHRNELPVPTVVHLHGGVVPPEHDGFPTDLLLPAGTHAAPGHHGGRIAHGVRAYRYPNDQPAATLWYHDHRMDFTGPQVYRGLAGLYLVRDDVEDGLPLPRGDREVPLVIADRFLHEDGSLFYPSLDPTLPATGCASSTRPTPAPTSCGWIRRRRAVAGWCRSAATPACSPRRYRSTRC